MNSYHSHLKNYRILAAVILGLSAAVPLPAQVVIPLTLFPSNQIGISVQLGTAPQPFTYLLDTGSVGFLTAKGNSTAWTGAFASTSPSETFDISYGSGALRYQGEVAHTTLTFTTTAGPVPVENVRLGAITTPPAIHPNWDADINHSPPIPPESNQFFGTLGAGLNKSEPGNGNFTSVLGQIPISPGLTKGFVVHTGGQGSSSATLTVGLSDEMINSFPILIAMNASMGNFTNDNGTTVNLYPQAQTTANYTITKGLDEYHATADLILDTGGLDTHVTTGTELDPPPSLLGENPIRIADGALFRVDVAGTNNPLTGELATSLDWLTDPTGTTPYQNLISVADGSADGSLNSGIPLFYQYDVMFDTEHGIIGLRPIPEPSSAAILLVGISLLLSAYRFRMHCRTQSGKPSSSSHCEGA